MSLGYPFDATNEFKQNVYSITLDMSGYDKTAIHVIPKSSPGDPIFIYGSNDGNALQGVRQGDAQLAINFVPIQGTSLTSGGKSTSIPNALNVYSVDVNARFLRLQGSGADVYRLLIFNSKIS